ncbi:conserved hypothetical protein [Halorhabdus utahensis DSM 12940]|uniref:Uncharacterized protein n=1 Tax=Halorhabdus utahensis (strain DSM 12940 / JCM 11049 / AX-2) TaxID=519442 RepID=C7NR74_HALUD|nr:DUF5778 family protein [Halorhabdus utahensis]ACV12987.1 conserved hypothetical protein [Halorhabdus utahensis DSM 12940]
MDAMGDDLSEQTKALLEPGEIELRGLIVRTDVANDQEPELNRLTIEIGDVIAEHAETDADTYVYSGTDDPEFGLNQHQGRTIEGEEFVWECQQLMRDGTFDVVFYYEDTADTDAILADLRAKGYDVEDVESP